MTPNIRRPFCSGSSPGSLALTAMNQTSDDRSRETSQKKALKEREEHEKHAAPCTACPSQTGPRYLHFSVVQLQRCERLWAGVSTGIDLQSSTVSTPAEGGAVGAWPRA